MKREQVKDKYKWNIAEIFATDEKWEEKFEQVSKNINFSEYSGKLGNKKVLLELLKRSSDLDMELERLAVYAQMRHDEDATISKYGAYLEKVYGLFSEYATAFAFFEPEMASQDEKYLQSLINDKDFADYDYQIKRIIARKPHVISEECERLIGMAGEIFETFSTTFGMMDNADLPLPEIEWEGKSVKLSHGLYGVIMSSANREKRKEAYEKYYGAYKSLINTITSTYFGNVKKDVYLTKVYKYGSCLEHALFSEDVDISVYNNLLKAVDDNLASLHRYVDDRKKILGYDKLYFYDINTPLVDGIDFKMPYDEAYDYVIEGLACLGEEYQALLKKAHDERWIDVEETDGKRNGAYSIRCAGLHPFVLLNYKPKLNDIFTIAHEMGHSLHTYSSSENQPFSKSEYKIFVAEVASTVNEVLLLKYMLKKHSGDMSTGISPPAGSLSAALIACDGFTLENAITLGL